MGNVTNEFQGIVYIRPKSESRLQSTVHELSPTTTTTTAMKVLILCALVAGCLADGLLHHAVVYAPAVHETGSSSQYRSQDPVGNYAFGYDEGHTTGSTFRKESGDAYGNKVGSYGLRDADGRVRVVNYVADALGYRADISSNEPGVAPKDPAATTINKGGLLAVADHHHHHVGYATAHPVAYAAPHPFAYGVAHPLAYTAHHYAAVHPIAYHGVLGAAYHGPVGHYSYVAPGHVASASVLGANHYSVKTNHLSGQHVW